MLKIKFYGTRGSVPVCETRFQEFGGNTTCISLDTSSRRALGILDAGTGLRLLGKELLKSESYKDLERIYIGFSHFHWDHIQGFPFFGPAYDGDKQVIILAMGKDRRCKNLKEIFSMQMQEQYFPVSMDQMGANLEFLVPDEDVDTFEEVEVRVQPQNHPGRSYGYRFSYEGSSVVVCTDIEHGEGLDPRIVEFARGADLLVHDAQYTTEELKRHRGWGHSSYDQAMQVAEEAGCKQLVMTHHDPDHDDEFLRKQEKICQERFKDAVLAREGMVFEV